MKRNLSTRESREFWTFVDGTAAEVNSWPAWMRGTGAPAKATHPGRFLSSLLSVHEMTQAALAEKINRPKKTINEIIQGKASVSAQTALDLEKVFEPCAEFWMQVQASWDLAQGRLAQERARRKQ